jgi:hypothetical protein
MDALDGAPQLLPAPQIVFCGFNRDVCKEKLNLVEFSTGKMAKSGAGATQIVRASFGMSARAAADFTISQSTLDVMPVPHTRPFMSMERNSAPSVMPLASVHFFTQPGSEPFGCDQLCPASRR